MRAECIRCHITALMSVRGELNTEACLADVRLFPQLDRTIRLEFHGVRGRASCAKAMRQGRLTTRHVKSAQTIMAMWTRLGAIQ